MFVFRSAMMRHVRCTPFLREAGRKLIPRRCSASASLYSSDSTFAHVRRVHLVVCLVRRSPSRFNSAPITVDYSRAYKIKDIRNDNLNRSQEPGPDVDVKLLPEIG
jgi:hypothetical protein